jgi:dephospho-CoA kinase
MNILCITGMPYSGKSEAAAALRRKGFTVVDMSDSVRELMKKERADAKSVDEFAMGKRRRFGKEVFAKLAAKKIPKHRARIAINGVRSIEEIRYFKKELDPRLLVVAITSPRELRYERFLKNKDASKYSYAEFLSHDRFNIRLGMGKAIKRADIVIANTGNAAELRSDINRTVKIAESALRGNHRINVDAES